jgi:ATP-binding cassette subfamily B protein
VLDEPTSSVDMKTESAIMKAMERLMKGRTTFIIAHRLSTLENCDLRLGLEKGRIVAPAHAEAPVPDGGKPVRAFSGGKVDD